MGTKVGPCVSDQNMDHLGSQQCDLNGVKGSRDSEDHHGKAVDMDLTWEDEVEWIQKNIKMRCKYMTSDESANDDCKCGNKKHQHQPITLSRRKQEADSHSTEFRSKLSKHTYTVPTNAFGKIKFVGFGGHTGKFVRVDKKTSMSKIVEMMINVWRIEKPKLVISVTGGAQNFNMKTRLRDLFRYGLIKAVQSTDAWIITGGTHTGVMKHVGEAVKEYNLTSANQKCAVAIGIAPWGVIQNRKVLENKEGSWPAIYSIVEQQKEEQNKHESFLDPNHSHFILVDNGTEHKFGTEISFRAELERKISEMQTDTGADAISVPMVLLVLEGGRGTLKTVKNALMEGTPAIIVKGSGRAADILAYAFKYAETVEVDAKDKDGVGIKIIKKQMKQNLKDDIAKQMEGMMFCEKKKIPFNIEQIQHCLDKSELIQIFEWNSSTIPQDIDDAILKVLLKAKKNQVMDQLELALFFNRVDVAKNDIFPDDKRWKPDEFDDIMLSAIKMNRVDFVELFLNNGTNLKKFLTIKRLLELYNNVPPESMFKHLLFKMNGNYNPNEEITLTNVGHLIQYLLGDYYLPYYISDQRFSSIGQEEDATDINPERELFIWSVLNNHQEMAKLFWLHGKDATAAALVAHALLTAMSEKTEDMALRAQITANASEFTDLAIGVLKECYQKDYKKAQQMLLRKLSHWGEATCIQIARTTKNKFFISQTACSDLFNSIWMGKMTQENNSLKLLFCITIPAMIPLLIRFKEKEDGELACEDQTSFNMQMKEESYPGGKTNTSLEQSHCAPSVQETNDDSKDETDQTEGDVKQLNIMKKIIFFYRAPVVIYINYVISYMIFLALYSYVLISRFEKVMSLVEMFLIWWVFAIFVDEVIQIKQNEYHTKISKFKSYATNGWNTLELMTANVFVIGAVLRIFDHPNVFEVARVFTALNLFLFFMKLLHIFSWIEKLGPKLMMLIHMAYDTISFLLILGAFIAGYGIASHALLYPNTELSLDTVIAIFRRPYWNIYGELMLEEVEGAVGCTDNAELYGNGTNPRCPTMLGKHFVPVLMGVYMMSTILLMNVFLSYTFEMVQGSRIQEYWCLHRYNLIEKYRNRFFPPPINIFVYIIQLFIPVQSALEGNDSSDLRQWEDVIADAFHHKRELAKLKGSDDRVNTTALQIQVDQLVNKIDDLQEKLHSLTETRSEKTLKNIEEQASASDLLPIC